VADDKDRGKLIQQISEAGIPFDASAHVDQLQATVDRLPLLLAEHERRGQAEAGEPTVPVSVDPGPDRTGNKLKGEAGSPDSFPGGSSQPQQVEASSSKPADTSSSSSSSSSTKK
jgi:hypothetical protein